MINTKTPKTLNNKFKFIICLVCFGELIVAKYPVNVVPIFAIAFKYYPGKYT